ncbi:hypothetical protein FGO68_gene4163 [Halteria grandinella]|uniref:Uncharacterized protein n=1 Tax=Halteria grandinella TaxID=5974 RepID=A0A8J8NVY8_HALGN|nr:hypothetical protein FGO68_gene4163 [Halteria grandinella]
MTSGYLISFTSLRAILQVNHNFLTKLDIIEPYECVVEVPPGWSINIRILGNVSHARNKLLPLEHQVEVALHPQNPPYVLIELHLRDLSGDVADEDGRGRAQDLGGLRLEEGGAGTGVDGDAHVRRELLEYHRLWLMVALKAWLCGS